MNPEQKILIAFVILLIFYVVTKKPCYAYDSFDADPAVESLLTEYETNMAQAQTLATNLTDAINAYNAVLDQLRVLYLSNPADLADQSAPLFADLDVKKQTKDDLTLQYNTILDTLKSLQDQINTATSTATFITGSDVTNWFNDLKTKATNLVSKTNKDAFISWTDVTTQYNVAKDKINVLIDHLKSPAPAAVTEGFISLEGPAKVYNQSVSKIKSLISQINI